MATKSIRWTAWILVLAGLAAVILTWLSDESPGYANHDSFSIVHITKSDAAEGGDGRVKVELNRPTKKGEVFLLKYVITAGNGASQSDLRNPLNEETTVRLSGWTTPDVRTIRIPIQTIQDQELDPDETIRVELTQLALQAKVKELSGEWVSHNKDFGQRTYDLSIIDDEARPSTPANLRAVPLGPDSVQLTWDASDGGKVNGESQTPRYVYQIDGNWGPHWGAIPGGNVTSHIVTGLDTFNNNYTFRIRAENDAVNSWFTGHVTSDNFRPATPTNLTATTIDSESVLLEWEAQDAGVGSDGAPIVPRYQYDVDGLWGDVPEVGATSHTVTGLDTFNNTYQFRVSALSGNARSWWTGICDQRPVARRHRVRTDHLRTGGAGRL